MVLVEGPSTDSAYRGASGETSITLHYGNRETLIKELGIDLQVIDVLSFSWLLAMCAPLMMSLLLYLAGGA